MQIVGIVLAAVLAPTAASAADTVSVVGTPDCGYDASTNTFRPVATVVRNSFGQLNPDNTHVGVSMQLFDGTTQIGSTLNTGKVGTTGNAAVDLPW